MYREDLAYIHDAGHGVFARDAAARLVSELNRAGHEGGTVVDLGCGSGITARALLERGYRVLGIDMSEAMVALARTRAPGAEFRAGSFVSAELPPSVAVTAIGEVLNYVFDSANNEGARAALLRAIYHALAPGGVFLFDVAGPERAGSRRPYHAHAAGRDWAVMVDTAVERGTGLLMRRITSFRQVGDLYRRDEEVHRLILLETTALANGLRDTGFEAETIARYGAEPLPAGVVAFVARKPAAQPVQTR